MVPGLDWGRFGAGSIIVDVGGGVGSLTLVFAKGFPQLHFVVQDRVSAIASAEQVSARSSRILVDADLLHIYKFWQWKAPEALTSGRVKLQSEPSW